MKALVYFLRIFGEIASGAKNATEAGELVTESFIVDRGLWLRVFLLGSFVEGRSCCCVVLVILIGHSDAEWL